MDKVYVVTDLGPGDGGKGSVIYALTHKVHADIILKRGGAQGSHGVQTSHGESFNFSQWGCGTLEGTPTHLTPQMVISPVGLDQESRALHEFGLTDKQLFDEFLTVDPKCVVATSYHQIGSEVEELLLKDRPRGTVGSGVGQAYRMFRELGEIFTIFADELSSRNTVYAKLTLQRQFYREKYRRLVASDVLEADLPLLAEALQLLSDEDYLLYLCDLFVKMGEKIRLRELSEVLADPRYHTAVVECSHGVLTDAETGLKPHVSAIRTLPEFTEQMLREAGYTGPVKHLAVHRAYEVRHGAGPLPTYNPIFTEKLFGEERGHNRWQGDIRAGKLDRDLIQHALASCEKTNFAGLCLTCYDQIDDASGAEAFYKASDMAIEFFGLPLAMLSIGPTETNKMYSQQIFK